MQCSGLEVPNASLSKLMCCFMKIITLQQFSRLINYLLKNDTSCMLSVYSHVYCCTRQCYTSGKGMERELLFIAVVHFVITKAKLMSFKSPITFFQYYFTLSFVS